MTAGAATPAGDILSTVSGSSVGPYQVLGELGRGGMGAVYRALDPRTGEEVALKLLLAGAGAQEHARRRFQREVEALMKLDHPGVVRIRDQGTHQGTPFLVMDLVPGQSLRERLTRQGRLPPGEALALAAALADTLAYCHARGIVHRDLNPANVIVREDGRPLLTDFGLARDLDPELSRLSQSGQFLGTPGYWAPEQAHGQRAASGPPSDVYGLGATLYALLTGAPPHGTPQGLAQAAEAARTLPPPPSQRAPGLWGALDQVVLRALAVDPAERYADGAALAAALRALSVPAPARPRSALLAGGLLTGAGLVAAALLLLAPRPAPAPAAPTPLASQRAVEPSPPELAQPPATPSGVELLELGAAAGRAGDRASALELLTRAAEVDPTLAFAAGLERWWALGEPNSLGSPAAREAAAALPALARSPGQQALGQAVARLLSDPLGAGTSLRRARELQADPALLCRVELVHSFLVQDLQAALQAAEQLTQVVPGSPRGWFELGRARDATGDLTGARAAYDRALELDPRFVSAWVNRAGVRAQLGDPAGLSEDSSRAIELAPDRSPDPYYNRARGHLDRRELDEALADYTRAIELGPEQAKHWLARAELRFLTRDLAGAEADWQAAARVDPSNGSIWNNLGCVRFEQGRAAEAVTAYDRALELQPDYAGCYANRAESLLALGQPERARADADRALELEPDHAWALVYRARAARALGDLSAARADLTRALDLNPDDPRVPDEARALLAELGPE